MCCREHICFVQKSKQTTAFNSSENNSKQNIHKHTADIHQQQLKGQDTAKQTKKNHMMLFLQKVNHRKYFSRLMIKSKYLTDFSDPLISNIGAVNYSLKYTKQTIHNDMQSMEKASWHIPKSNHLWTISKN